MEPILLFFIMAFIFWMIKATEKPKKVADPVFFIKFLSSAGEVHIKGGEVTIVPKIGLKRFYNLSDINKIELLTEESVNMGSSVTAGILGALVAGPVGAAAGASAGRMLRKCTFIIEIAGEKPIAVQNIYKLYEALIIHYRINK